MLESVGPTAPDDPASQVEPLRGGACVRGPLVPEPIGDVRQRTLLGCELGHCLDELPLARWEPVENALHMRLRLVDRLPAPSGADVLGGDDAVGAGVPGALPGELEEERLAAGELDDGALGVGLHEDPVCAAVGGGDRPPLADEGVECGQKVVVVDGLQRGGLETTREGGTGSGSGHVRELGQPGQVDGDRKRRANAQAAGKGRGLLVSECVTQGDEQLGARVLISDVLDLVDVDHHHGMALGGRTADLNEQIGQGGIRLGTVLGSHGQGDAGSGHGLNAAQQVADALLPGCWQTRRVGEGQ